LFVNPLSDTYKKDKLTFNAWIYAYGAEVVPTVCAVDAASRYAATILASAAAIAALY
jgi:hypothetical protein